MIFVDSWGWIALSNKGEKEFNLLRLKFNQFIQARVPLLTSDFILDEAISFVFKRLGYQIGSTYFSGLFGSVEKGAVQIIPVTNERFWKAWQLRQRFSDKPEISFTDLTSFVIMEELGISEVVSNDRHFEMVNLGFRRVK
jgi:predicted nucleic acid-binding protein